MNLAQHIEVAGRNFPTCPAVGYGEHLLYDYAALAHRVAGIGSALRNNFHLAPGDRVAIVATNAPEYLETLYAIWHAGCVAVPANAKLHGAELAYILEHSGARTCFASADLASVIEAHAPSNVERIIAFGGRSYNSLLSADVAPVVAREPDDLAWLFYTSGTTGRPKGAMLSHRNLAAMSEAYASEVNRIGHGDPILHAAPMSHGSGLYMVPYVAKCGVNVVPESGGFDPNEIFRLIDVWPGASLFAAPTMVKRLVECPGECRNENIGTIVWGGAPMYVEDTLAALDRFGPRLTQIYGQGESPMTITVLPRTAIAAHDRPDWHAGHDRADWHATGHDRVDWHAAARENPRWRARLASAGRPFSRMKVIVADADDAPLPTGETGEILCQGEAVMAGYWQDEAASAATLRGGYLHTGDIGAFDAEGYLYLKDRSKDLIISGGSNIYPREVEEVLLRHPGLREVSVIGRPDREWGEIVVAYLVGAADPADLDALCRNAIARFKRPKDYVFIEGLPKNNYGKVLKTELRALDAARMANST